MQKIRDDNSRNGPNYVNKDQGASLQTDSDEQDPIFSRSNYFKNQIDICVVLSQAMSVVG